MKESFGYRCRKNRAQHAHHTQETSAMPQSRPIITNIRSFSKTRIG
ncbi:hypothetical protein [Noviherbaspirillum pedocola]|uniref:Uncharacterized protein n=1 Tax=Noviherbaspirillum pedocola TaxID=2801341 RepID=A0A934W9I8_9BURK|nr:hypothetical protein [Noviherbaspirillum pedocola]MBK4737124.1 hypothetical protein [Noviherbaspirillum pedocola]